MKTILKESFQAGRASANLDPQAVQERKEYIQEKAIAYATEKIEKLKILGARLNEKRKKIAEEYGQLLMNRPLAAHKANFRQGIYFFVIFLAILACEFALLRWCFAPYDFRVEGYILSLTLTLAASTALEFYLRYLQNRDPEGYAKHRLSLVFVSVILFVASVLLLSFNRASLMSASKKAEGLESQVETATRFYSHSAFLYIAIVLAALAVILLSGILLQEALSRFTVSGPVIRLSRLITRLETSIAAILSKIKEFEVFPQKAVGEYERGRFAEPRSPIHPLLSPLGVLIITLAIVLAIAVFASGQELRPATTMLFLDISWSAKGADYLEKSEFQKNVLYVDEIINKLEPGERFLILGITEKSFEKPLIILDRTLSREVGYFSEKVAKDKLNIMNDWKKVSVQANAKATDIFGALQLATLLSDGVAGRKKLILMSDMRNTVNLDLETPQLITDKTIPEAERKGLIADLSGVQVWVIGVSTINKSFPYWNSLKLFWTKYFEKAGAQLMAFSAERNIVFNEKKGEAR
jgi:hypothetical protein